MILQNDLTQLALYTSILFILSTKSVSVSHSLIPPHLMNAGKIVPPCIILDDFLENDRLPKFVKNNNFFLIFSG